MTATAKLIVLLRNLLIILNSKCHCFFGSNLRRGQNRQSQTKHSGPFILSLGGGLFLFLNFTPTWGNDSI